MSPLLDVQRVSKSFGGLAALSDVSFDLDRGEVVAVIGPNGAGKTTLFNCLTGFLRPDSGAVWFDGHRIDRWSSNRTASHGLVRTFQSIRMFPGLTVYESMLASVPTSDRRNRKSVIDDAVNTIERLQLAPLANRVCQDLPLLAQRTVEVGRALMTRPTALLLDEPTAGATLAERDILADLMRDLRSSGVSLILIEHNVPFVMSVSTRVVVMHFGKVVASGTPVSIAGDPVVREIYLGG
ncbi:MAG: ABC transporter ATP-binding protein [Chloroflexi bacterium]|nr:ABC transporter ATP-binding protein [Chloroflexota bacterium]